MPKKKKVRGKKIQSSSVPKEKRIVLSGTTALTPDEHILRQRALLYLTDQKMPIKDVARRLNTTKTVIRSFFEDAKFVEELEERIERVDGIDKGWRSEQAKMTLSHLYEEIRRREVEGMLEDVPVQVLHKMIIDTQKEIRLDTPGEFTSKVGVQDLATLQDRFSQSLSGKVHRVRSGQKVIPIKSKTSEEEAGGPKSKAGRTG